MKKRLLYRTFRLLKNKNLLKKAEMHVNKAVKHNDKARKYLRRLQNGVTTE